jgi:diadenylate cyclase
MISKQLGTRHRAAIGITEDSDALVVLVSEETGSISVASGGTIDVNLTPDELDDRLSEMVMRRRTTLAVPAASPPARTTVRR